MNRLRTFFQSLGIRQQISIVLISGIFALSVISSIVVSTITSKKLDSLLTEQIQTITQNYAEESVISLLYQSQETAKGISDRMLQFPNVVGTKILTSEGKTLYESGAVGFSTNVTAKISDEGYYLETDELSYFALPVYVNESSDIGNSPFYDKEESRELLGYVEVVVSRSALSTLMHSIYSNSLMVSFIVAVILLLLLIPTTNLVANPIKTLSLIMNRAEQGDINVRAELMGSKEILMMETAFNTMMTTLESRAEELKRARDTALASARIKGQFATTVSHELRTPMNGVMGMLELLHAMELNEEQREYVNIARTSGEELLLLIDDILDFSKIESGKLKLQVSNFDPREMLKNITELLSPQAQLKNISLDYEMTEDILDDIAGDAGRVRQVILNLVGNALKFTHHGSIKIRVSKERQKTKDSQDTQEMLCVTVADTGIGIPYHAQQMIFEAFSQADGSTTRQFGGTGLGLAISSQLVELMGGKIGVKSEPGKGSQFWFTLPLKVHATISVSQQIPAKLIGLRILLVSRTTTSCHALLNIFGSWDAQQRTTTNADEALALLQYGATQGKPYDVMVVDTPIADGEEISLLNAVRNTPLLEKTFILLLSHTQHQNLPANSLCVKKQPSEKLLEQTFLKFLDASTASLHDSTHGNDLTLALRVLIVEDNKTNQMVAKRMVEKLGCSCVTAENGNFAITALEREPFDVVLMDCNMPFMNGYTATQLIRGKKSAYQNVPIIALTATTNQLDINRCYKAGMNEYLAKPLKLEQLQHTLKKYIVSNADTKILSDHRFNPRQEQPSYSSVNQTRDLPLNITAPTRAALHKISTPAETLDKNVLDNLENQLGSSFTDFIDSYLHDTPSHIGNLNSAVKENNLEQIRYFAQLIKGSSGNMGARHLAALCQRLEMSNKQDQEAIIKSTYAEICEEYKKVVTLLSGQSNKKTPDIDIDAALNVKPYILIADDDNSSRIIMRSILEKDGYRTKEARNGAEALHLCQEKMPDLVLMDAMMPIMDGFTASEHIMAMDCENYPTILMITALTDEGTLERAFAAGATDFILKPINMTVLRQRVSRVLHTGHIDRHIHQLSYYDNLTSLPNRTFFVERSKKLLIAARESHYKIAVLFLDLDRFKLINDSKGHEAGDILLKNFAKRLESCVRSVDIVARLGGDEFTVVLNNINSSDDAVIVANKILASLQEPIDSQERQLNISTSIGIALFPEDGETISELMKHADTAMFQAKAKGGKSYEFYHGGMELEIKKQIELEIEIREALEKDEFELYYQPQVNLKTGELTGLEALIRWNHPTRGFVPPVEFIPFAEKTNLITQIGDWVLTHACKQQAIWLAQGFEPVPIAVNVSGYELADSVLLSKVENALLHTNIPASLIKLEITEDTLAGCDEQTTQHLHDLRGLGTNLAIDDFGTGYSSLSYLKMFPVDTLKIDRSFIKDLPEDVNSAAIVSGIIALGHSLKLIIVAEGVETDAQRQFLVDEGCDIMQGYFISKPLPISALEDWIVNEHAHPGYLLDNPKTAAMATPRARPPL